MPWSLPRSISTKSPGAHVAAILVAGHDLPHRREVGLARRFVAIGAGRHDRRDERDEVVALRDVRAEVLERARWRSIR